MYVSLFRSLLVGAAAIAAILPSAQAFAQRGILGRALQGAEQEGARRSQPAQPQFRAGQPQTQGALLMPGGLKRLQPQGTLQIVPGAIQPLGGERVPHSLPRNQPGSGWSSPQAGGFDFGRDLLSPMAQGMGTGQPAGSTRPPGYDISRPGAGWSSPSGAWSPGGVWTPADGGASYSGPPAYYPGEFSAAQPAGTPASSPKSIPEPAYQGGPVPAAYVPLPPPIRSIFPAARSPSRKSPPPTVFSEPVFANWPSSWRLNCRARFSTSSNSLPSSARNRSRPTRKSGFSKRSATATPSKPRSISPPRQRISEEPPRSTTR
jgi:hypothetical protein